ncbi:MULTISPECIES: lipoyl(octanoyl) transferase LipB [Shewanella]|uniref:Octanoyltransferase n=1 Tax=Shewanella electrica TaxID=515560 RepID=A0ABT2FI54_9GAMM|nr:lipoyl(octanoyl) transferase LipB [Shewanella electrica]MCH1917953.1 lipoyl(octanoyl) transferase LipB [Shewanella ferrihydritica]MCH1925105.1 lipoyl(octanoyl) transferase LipB [Shewanella electrica]MCS4554929.1 lipoyl(octanoyl) transferase LipB [Shewanella electrica]
MSDKTLHICHLGMMDYETVWHAMQQLTDDRDETVEDQLWLVEHPPVFTQGQAGKAEHLLNTGDIPVIQVDRGGQVTYHGPGQMVAYPLLNVKRLKIGVRQLVTDIEQTVVSVLAKYDIEAYPKADAPGVYVNGDKIASLGLRIRRGCSFHGVAFNINMDLEPFHRINPCGYAGLEMTQAKQLGGPQTVEQAANEFAEIFSQRLGYTQLIHHQGLPKSL